VQLLCDYLTKEKYCEDAVTEARHSTIRGSAACEDAVTEAWHSTIRGSAATKQNL